MPPSSNSDLTHGHRYALCVGIGTYTNLSNRNLRYAVAHATTIAERLADPQRGNFAVTLLTEPTQTSKAALDEAVEKLLSAPDRRAEDLTVIYFSCHGDVYADNTFCLLPSNATLQADRMLEQMTLISIYDLAKWFSRARAKNIVVLLDVCYSGGAGAALQHFMLDLSTGPNFFIIGAARQDQVAMQSSLLQHGQFTHCLLRAFEQPPAKDGWLTISQIQNFVSSDISWFAKDQPIQIQTWSVFVDPHLPLLRNPGYPEFCPLPPLWNVPLQRNLFFTGQDNLLSQLASMLQSEQKTALTQPHAVAGLGGIGKTQLALEYAYRHRQAYHAILWGRAETREDLIATFVSIADLLGLPEKEKVDELIKDVKKWLAGRSQWLLILDNADDLALVKEFLPPAFQGHLLLTTRAQSMGGLARKLEVEAMQPKIGALLLLRRAGLLAHKAPLEAADATQVIVAKELSEELGGLPLALDQAGAYIEETQCSLSAYQSLYRTHRAELLSERGGILQDHPEAVTTTWSLSFNAIAKRSAAAADVLRLCAFLHSDAIPEELFLQGAVYLGPMLATLEKNPLTLNRTLAVIQSYSLLRRNGHEQTLSMHRLVQAVLHDAMTEQEREQWTERAIAALDAIFPNVTHEVWGQCERLLPHVLACAATMATQKYSLELASLLTKAAYYLGGRAQSEQAESLFQRALHIREQALGPEHPQVADLLYGLASLYNEYAKQEDQYRSVEPLLQRALHIWEQALGSEHSNVANSLNGLAILYRGQGRYAEAEPLFQRALHIREQALGPEHPQVTYSLNGLALLYYEQGRYAEAEPLYQRALHIWEQMSGPEHPGVAYPLNNLAILYREQGRYAEAESLYQRALHIREQALGPEHPDVAFPLAGLAILYREQGRYAEAEPLFQRALHIWEQTLGPEHSQVAPLLTNLAVLYREQGKYEQAEPLFQRVLHIFEQALGSEHPQLASSLNGLAVLYREQGKYEQAEPLYQRALTIRQQQRGAQHPETAESLHDFAHFYEVRNQPDKALVLYQQALAIREQRLGLEHPRTIDTRMHYAHLLRASGRPEEAATLEASSAHQATTSKQESS